MNDPAQPERVSRDTVVLFDGSCRFCTASVRFIIRHDHRSLFQFVPSQSDLGTQLCRLHGFDPDQVQSILLLNQGKAYSKTDAVIEIARRLGGCWRLVTWLKCVPGPIRNWVYAVLARYRYRLFGRQDACTVPSKDMQP